MKLSVRKKLFISFFLISLPLTALIFNDSQQSIATDRRNHIELKKQNVELASKTIMRDIREVRASTRLIVDDLIRDHGLSSDAEQMHKYLLQYTSTLPHSAKEIGLLDKNLKHVGTSGKKNHIILSELPKKTNKDLMLGIHIFDNNPYLCILDPLDIPAASFIHICIKNELITYAFATNKKSIIAVTTGSGNTMIFKPGKEPILAKDKTVTNIAKKSRIGEITIDNKKQDIVSTEFFEKSWRLSLISPPKQTSFFGLGQSNLINILMTFLASLFFAIIAGLSLTKPLRMLREYAKNMSKLNFEKIKPIKSGDEFELLFNTFNSMNNKIKKYIHSFNQKNEELLAIINNSQSGVLITDKTGRVITMNKTARQFFGWCNCTGKDQSMCLPYLQTLEGDDLSNDDSPMKIALKGKKFSNLILEARNPDAAKKYIFNFHGTPLKDDNNKIYGSAVMFMDITEQYRLQERLRRMVNYEKTKSNHLSILHNVSLSLNKEKSITKIEEIVLKAAVEITDAKAGVIIKKQNNKYEITSRYAFEESDDVESAICLSDINYLFKNKLFRNSESMKIANFSKFNKELKDKKGSKIKAMIVTPFFRKKHKLVGHLLLVNKKRGRRFSNEDEKVAQILCSHAAVALTNAINYKREHHIAQVLQKSLLPTTSFAKSMAQDVQVSLAYKPATAGALVGGDFYDFFDLGDRTTGCLIADVNGKGVEAATLTSLAKNTIKAFAYEGYAADKVLQKTNNILYHQTGSSVFVTAIFGILDLKNGFFEYANAGHHEPFLYRDDINKVLKLNKGSTPLGVLATEDYELHVCDLKPHDSLVLYTDGLVEGRKNGEFFGEERLINCLLSNAPLPISLADKILEDLENFTDGKLNDDVAIVALKLKKPVQRSIVEKRISVWS